MTNLDLLDRPYLKILQAPSIEEAALLFERECTKANKIEECGLVLLALCELCNSFP